MRRGRIRNRLIDYWAGIPLLNAAATLHRKRALPAPHQIKKLGVLCSPALGDTLLFSSALQDLRAAFPDAELVHCCMPLNRAAASVIPGANRQILIQLTRPGEAIPLLRAERFDLLADYTSWQRLTALLTLFSGAKFTAGFSTPGMRRSRGYDMTVEHSRTRHEVENFRALTRALGVAATHGPALRLGTATDAGAVWPHSSLEGPDAAPLVLLHLWPSGQRAALREWPVERWTELATQLSRKIPGAVFGATTTLEELARTNGFIASLQAAGLDAHPIVATFEQLAALVTHARLVVSVNTGVMHLAAISGTPTVSINGPNSNLRWGPVGPRAFGVDTEGPGCGFLHLGFDFDGQRTDCMEQISVEEVLHACSAVLHTR